MYTFYQAPEDDGRGYYMIIRYVRRPGLAPGILPGQRQQFEGRMTAEIHCDILYNDDEDVRVEDQLEYVWQEIGTATPSEIADFTWGHIMGYDEIFEGTLKDWVEARRAMHQQKADDGPYGRIS